MKRQFIWISLLSATAAVAALGVGIAGASGPGGGSGTGSGDNGRSVQTIDCGGTPFSVAVPNAQNANGAGQIVDAKGHGIPVTGTFTITDTTTGTQLDLEPFGRPGHPNQTPIECTGTAFTATAADIFPPGVPLPPGVSPTDTVVGSLDVWVILKQ